MKRVLLASASALAIVTGSAFAADVIPEPVPEPTWTGLHVGVGGGAGYNFYEAENLASLDAVAGAGGLGPLAPGEEFSILSNAIAGDDLGAWYGFGTVEIGFDYQFADSPFVIGILANYDFNGNTDAEASSRLGILDGLVDLGAPAGLAALNNRLEVEADDSWFLGARAGFAVFNNASLIYILGGYTWMDGSVKSEHSLDILGTEVANFSVDEEDNVDGWTLGGGVETMLWENLSLKVEYRHDFLDDIEFNDRTVLAEDNDDGDALVVDHDGKVDFSRDTIRAVLSWRFDPFGGM